MKKVAQTIGLFASLCLAVEAKAKVAVDVVVPTGQPAIDRSNIVIDALKDVPLAERFKQFDLAQWFNWPNWTNWNNWRNCVNGNWRNC